MAYNCICRGKAPVDASPQIHWEPICDMSWDGDRAEEIAYGTPTGETCPHLGWQDDAETHYAYPNMANYRFLSPPGEPQLFVRASQ
jgi:hypothetical protein